VNARILRIELRRTIAPWAALVSLVVALGFLYSFSGPWTKEMLAWNEQWTLAAYWTRFLLVFLWPIAIGAGVIGGMRDSRSGMVELLTTMSRPGLHRAAKLAVALGGLLALSYLVVFAVGAVQAMLNGGFFSFAWLPIVLVGVLSLIAGAWIGLGVGRLLPHPLTAPALAVPVFAAVLVFPSVPAPEIMFEGPVPLRVGLLSPAFHVIDDPFLITAGRVDLGQSIWLAGLAIAGLMLLAAGSRRAKALAAVPLVVALAVALPVLPATSAESKSVDPVAIEQVCDGPVCVTRMNEAQLARIAGPAKEALQLLGTLPGAPVKVVELDRRLGFDEVPPRAADAVIADLRDWSLRLSTETGDVKRALLAGAGTPSCFGYLGGPSLDERTARTIAAAWFLGDLKPLKFSGWVNKEYAASTERLWATFRALPEGEQRTRIIALRQAGLTCQGNQLDILVGGGAR
jgi:uncharacterized integral membrane protein